MAFVRQIDRLELPFRSSPGFLRNAGLAPYRLEALHAVDEGLAAEMVDAAMLDCRTPMRSIKRVDMAGLDIVIATEKQSSGR